MTEREGILLDLFRRLSVEDQNEALDYLDWLVESVYERRTVVDRFEEIISRN